MEAQLTVEEGPTGRTVKSMLSGESVVIESVRIVAPGEGAEAGTAGDAGGDATASR